MTPRRAAGPYAKALFALAKERDQTELVGRELGDMAGTFDSDPGLRDFLARPWIAPAVKRAVAMDIARRSGLSKLSGDFLALVAARGRGDHLAAIVETYRALVDEDLGRLRARVRTAIPLTDDERGMLTAKLLHALGGRQAVLEEVVDPAMLGGFTVESGSILLDGSLEGQLERLRRRLATG